MSEVGEGRMGQLQPQMFYTLWNF